LRFDPLSDIECLACNLNDIYSDLTANHRTHGSLITLFVFLDCITILGVKRLRPKDLSMKSLRLGSISRNLYVMVMLAILPALAIILYSGLEERKRSIENAQNDVLLLTHTMAEAQQDLTRSVRQMLALLSLLPEIQRVDLHSCRDLFKAVLDQNPNYLNIALTDLNGDVLVSGKPLTVSNFGDRKHVRDVLERKEFSIGEYILSRIGPATPAFAFAYPVLDKNNRLKSVLTTAIKLTHFSDFHDISNLPEKSFVALTDHRGIRILYYPQKEDTNPVGQSIKKESWEKASRAKEPGIFIGQGSDGHRRIFAYEQVRFKPGDIPYLYVWTGTPETDVLAPANAALTRNLLLLILVTVLSLLISWLIGQKTLMSPIQSLVDLTRKFAQGDLEARSTLTAKSDEFGMLTKAFHDMADSLAINQRTLRENEAKLARSKKMESLGLLAGGVAHDLNNVLSGIVNYPELILMDLPDDSNLRESIEAIQSSGQRAAAIVQDLLTVARGVAITKEALNLNTLVDEYLHSPEFKKIKQVYPFFSIKTNFDMDLFNIRGSHVHIRKSLMNLVSNAVDAINGNGTITISSMNRYMDRPIRGYDDVTIGEYVVLSVLDDGSGISSDDLDRIFEPFYTKKIMGRSGTGLGLAVVWNTMLDHKGYIDVLTDEHGTAFELYFPATREKLSVKDLSIPMEDYKGNGETILVVDDVESQRDISCRMLEILGYKTKALPSGEEAVEYLKENTSDLIILDMIMDPGINGRETYERIIDIHPEQKAIVVSGFAVTDDVKAVQKLGAGKYIKKPYTIKKIGLAVKEELKKLTT
jgi:signal transduction histidine kinase/ActR/RegA family two-component response regulator